MSTKDEGLLRYNHLKSENMSLKQNVNSLNEQLEEKEYLYGKLEENCINIKVTVRA